MGVYNTTLNIAETHTHDDDENIINLMRLIHYLRRLYINKLKKSKFAIPSCSRYSASWDILQVTSKFMEH